MPIKYFIFILLMAIFLGAGSMANYVHGKVNRLYKDERGRPYFTPIDLHDLYRCLRGAIRDEELRSYILFYWVMVALSLLSFLVFGWQVGV